MSTQFKTRDLVWKSDSKWGHNIERRGDEPYFYLSGHVRTQYGFVIVFTTIGATKNGQYTTLDFVWEGFTYRRTIEREVSERYLKTIARRYAKEIAESK